MYESYSEFKHLNQWILFEVFFTPFIHQNETGPALTVWYKNPPELCQSMTIIFMFCFQSPIFWMFIEGIYLHSRVSTNIFNHAPPFNIYYLIGWGKYSDKILKQAGRFEIIFIWIREGLPLFTTLIWVAAMRLTSNNETCWEDYSDNKSIFIIVIPILSILMVFKYCTDC